MQSQNYIE
jgi:hypothetical protein